MVDNKLKPFIRTSMNGIRRYLLQEFGLIHNDQHSAQLARHLGVRVKGNYEIRGFVNTPRVLNVKVAIPPTFLGKVTAPSTREAMSLAARLPNQHTMGVRRGDHGLISFELPKPDEFSYNLFFGYDTPKRTGQVVSLGRDMSGKTVEYDFTDSVYAHLFVAGMTGSGKTEVLKLIIAALSSQNTPEKLRFILADYGKAGFNFKAFGSLEHLLTPVVTTLEDTVSALLFMSQEIDRRTQMDRQSVALLPRYMLVIDEVQEVFLGNPEASSIARKIVAMGREFNISLILSTQYPNKEYMGNNQAIKNMVRWVGRASDAMSAYTLSGVPDSGAETLLGKGDFLSIDGGTTTRLQVALATPRTIRALPRRAADYVELPEVEEPDEPEDKRVKHVSPEMVLAAYEGATAAELRRQFSITNALAKRALAFSTGLFDRMAASGYIVTKSKDGEA